MLSLLHFSHQGTSTAFPSWFLCSHYLTSQIVYLIWQELLWAATSAREALKHSKIVQLFKSFNHVLTILGWLCCLKIDSHNVQWAILDKLCREFIIWRECLAAIHPRYKPHEASSQNNALTFYIHHQYLYALNQQIFLCIIMEKC